MTSASILRNTDLDSSDIWQARVDLAACFRAAAARGLHEGVCNHLSFMVPGVPVPRHIAEATAEQMRHEDGRASASLHLASIKRQLDRAAPEYRQ